ncbi:sensor histidine kinase [Lacrimispora saccharolytica]|uniref:sensor histidine kinase n=1 Tax=Lacrimispora saccharolytica TaxID=84030 RepID=UPI00265D3AF4|nr:HAMP domain-containing sensor histidine kinase [Lacrimispora saccharolytica]MCF2656310.1 HAMP domain-containing histidine kinase [Lacrimispora saccharolytica]
MRFKKKAGNTFFTVLMFILASVATASLYYIIVSGYMSVSKDGVTASQYIKYRDYKGEPFEDTDLFTNELYGAINDITTLCTMRESLDDSDRYNIENMDAYSTVMELSDRYSKGHTNVKYCYQLVDDKGIKVRHSNVGDNITTMSTDEVTKYFTSLGKYICFNPDKVQMATNINDAISIEDILGNFDYNFAEGSRIWIGVDTDYPADDILKLSKETYAGLYNYYFEAIVSFAVSTLLLLAILVILTINAGKVTLIHEDDTQEVIVKSARIDHIPIEILAIVTILTLLLLSIGSEYALDYLINGKLIKYNSITAITLAGIAGFVICAIKIFLYLIYVRKFKCKLMWNTSLCRLVLGKSRQAALDLYDNGSLVVRTWLPYLIFLALNLVLVLLGLTGTLIAFIIDMFVGVWLYNESRVRSKIVDGIDVIAGGDAKHKIDTAGMHGYNLNLAEAVNSIGDGIDKAVSTSMKDERMKADLITNVSHDIKTPLTSIINYVDLLKRANIEDETARGYIDILEQKSLRLKALTNDLVEISKISSGNITLELVNLNMVEMINQVTGEFDERFKEKSLIPILNLPKEDVVIHADGQALYRILENLYINIYKYALRGTRVYIDLATNENKALLTIRNISAEPVNLDSAMLTERFIRGDISRGTEGSGLGLSIAKSLAEAQNGRLDLSLDGDLFKVVVSFDLIV